MQSTSAVLEEIGYIHQQPSVFYQSWLRCLVIAFACQLVPTMLYLKASREQKRLWLWALAIWAWPLVIPYKLGAAVVGFDLRQAANNKSQTALKNTADLLPSVIIVCFGLMLAIPWLLAIGICLIGSPLCAILEGTALVAGTLSLDDPSLADGMHWLVVVGYAGLFWLGVSLVEWLRHCRKQLKARKMRSS
jgi:hypothetical protein